MAKVRFVPVSPQEGHLFNQDVYRVPTNEERAHAKSLGPQFWRRCPLCNKEIPMWQSLPHHVWESHTEEGFRQSYAGRAQLESEARNRKPTK